MSLKPREVNYDDLWKDIFKTLNATLNGDIVTKEDWQNRTTDIYWLCVAIPKPYSRQLYEDTKLLFERHVLKLKSWMEEMELKCLLVNYNESWKLYDRSIVNINYLYKYFNKNTLQLIKTTNPVFHLEPTTTQTEVMEIEELGLSIWGNKMISLYEKELVYVILHHINCDRIERKLLDTDVIRNIIFSLIEMQRKTPKQLQLYEDLLETKLLEESKDFYTNKSLQLLDTFTGSEYIMQVRQLINSEHLRVKKYLPVSSQQRMIDTCRQQLVEKCSTFLHEQSKHMINKLLLDDLSNLYNLCLPSISDSHFLVKEFEEHIKNIILDTIRNIPSNDTTAQTMVESVVELHTKYTDIVKNTFANDPLFTNALDKACNYAINHKFDSKTICQSAEHLARYCDALLKKSIKTGSESELEDKLSSSITIFRYLDDKDIFNRFYGRMLAKRLIYSQSQSMEAEESMINKLKQVCGYEFTNKLHRMFTDVNISSDLNAKFTTHMKTEMPTLDLGLSFSILILQAGAWPITSTSQPTFALPQQFEKSIQMFEAFYLQNYSGRKLNWVHSFCQCELKLTYLKRVYLVSVSTFLASLLLPFNDATSLTVKELRDVSQLSDRDFDKTLQLLIDAKLLLSTLPLQPDSAVSLNFEYNNKRTKFKIIPMQKDSLQEVEQTRLAANEDRKIYLQATIVRIMKARKNILHNQLIQEVLAQSKSQFAPNVALIKRCIETLIDRQYIERSQHSNDLYSYIA